MAKPLPAVAPTSARWKTFAAHSFVVICPLNQLEETMFRPDDWQEQNNNGVRAERFLLFAPNATQV